MKKIAISVVTITTLILTNALVAQGGFLVASSLMDELLSDPVIVQDAQDTAVEKCIKKKPNTSKYSKEIEKYKAVPKKLALYKKKLAMYLKTQQNTYNRCIKLKKTAYFKELEKELNALERESDSATNSWESSPSSTPSVNDQTADVQDNTQVTPNNSQDEDQKHLLLSSKWCTSSFSGSSGGSPSYSNFSQTTITFSPDGTYSMITNSENSSVGYGGDYFGSGATPFSGQWKIENGKFMLADDSTNGQFYDPQIIQTQYGFQSLLTKKEYSRC